MAQLNERLETFERRVGAIATTPLDNRQRTDLQNLAKDGAQLAADLERLEDTSRRAVLRAALAEDLQAARSFDDHDMAVAGLTRVRPLAAYVEGVLARREGRKQVARARLEDALPHLAGALSTDALSLLIEIHQGTEQRSNWHAMRGLELVSLGPKRDLDVAARELREALSLDPRNLTALHATARLHEEQGRAREALTAHLRVIAAASGRRSAWVDIAYARLIAAIAVEAQPLLPDLVQEVVYLAALHEARHGKILAALFARPDVAGPLRQTLADRLTAAVSAYAAGDRRIEDAHERRLITSNASHLRTLATLVAHGDLAAADAAMVAAPVNIRAETPAGAEVSRVTVARMLARLWRERFEDLLDRGKTGDDLGARLVALLGAQDRMLNWLGEAIDANTPTDALFATDVRELADEIAILHHITSDKPLDEESALALVPSDAARARLEPVIRATLQRLKRAHRSYDELGAAERLDEWMRSIAFGLKLTEFATGEMSANVLERIVRTGSDEERSHAYLSLAKLYLEQHRYDPAIASAQAAVALDGRNPEAPYRLGLIYMKAGKRLLAIEQLRDAAERCGHPEAHVALAEDCARDDQPHHAAAHYIAAAGLILKSERKVTSRDLDAALEWLRKARRINGDVQPYPVVLDKSLGRRERKERQKEIEDRNNVRMAEVKAREQQIVELMGYHERLKTRGK